MKNIFLALVLLTSMVTFAADKKISDLNSLGQASWASGDLFPIVDVSASETKKTSVADFDGRYQTIGSYITALTGDVSASGPGSSVATISNLARSKLATGTINQVVINNGSGVLSSEAQLALSRGGVNADLSATGGTSQVLKQVTTGAAITVARLACSDLSNAVSSCSTDATNATNITSGTLPVAQLPTVTVAKGGTGQTSYTDGQLLIGNTSTGFLSKATLTQGSNITITNGNGTISIAASSSALPADNFTAQSTGYSAVVGDYIQASGSSFSILLPTAVGVSGKQIAIEHAGTSLTNLYTLTTTSGQTIDGIASGSYVLWTNKEFLLLESDNANWKIKSHKTKTTWSSDVVIPWSATGAYVFSWTGSKNVILGDKYCDVALTGGLCVGGNTYIVSASTNTTSGTFSEVGTATPATTGTLTVLSPGTSASPISWTSRTITGVPAIGTSTTNRQIYKRDGDEIDVYFEFNTSGVGTGGTGNYIQLFPTNVVADITQITPLTSAAVAQNAILKPTSEIGRATGTYGAGPTDLIDYRIILYSNSGVRLSGWATASGGTLDGGANYGFGNASANVFGRYKFKVVGWQP